MNEFRPLGCCTWYTSCLRKLQSSVTKGLHSAVKRHLTVLYLQDQMRKTRQYVPKLNLLPSMHIVVLCFISAMTATSLLGDTISTTIIKLCPALFTNLIAHTSNLNTISKIVPNFSKFQSAYWFHYATVTLLKMLNDLYGTDLFWSYCNWICQLPSMLSAVFDIDINTVHLASRDSLSTWWRLISFAVLR